MISVVVASAFTIQNFYCCFILYCYSLNKFLGMAGGVQRWNLWSKDGEGVQGCRLIGRIKIGWHS